MSLFQRKVEELGLTPIEFFETAYMWRFGYQGHVVPDYCNFLQGVPLPKYVEAYLTHLEGDRDAMQEVQGAY